MSVSRREFMGIVSTAALAGVAGAACDNEAGSDPGRRHGAGSSPATIPWAFARTFRPPLNPST